MTERDYIDKIASGNHSAFSHLYESYRSEFIGYFRNHYKKPDDYLVDLYQDSCTALWNNIQTGRLTEKTLTSSLKTYLFSIAKYQLISNDRKRKEITLDVDADYLRRNEDLFSTEYEYAVSERQQIIQQAVNDMREPCNTLLLLYYWEEKSGSEIAEAMKYKNPDSVKAQKFKCMNKLKTLLMNRLKTEGKR